ncbi:MAG: tRNA lysidine(34) synthetase TilS [Prochlorococcaceae cyanobacterium]
MDPILPSEAAAAAPNWGRQHLRLHRQLLRHPQLLPRGAPLLLAVSGGQDSMALTGLLLDLQRLHGWSLQLWHGDHRWRAEAAAQAAELAAWAGGRGLNLHHDRAPARHSSEAEARTWRYGCLERLARQLGCGHVVCGHTASDRAETLLLHLARGSHRRGLASLRAQRPLAPSLTLVRPLLIFSRSETAQICSSLGLPVWPDASNDDRRYSRNRLRAEVLPVLEALHPGASRRLSGVAERLAAADDASRELIDLALAGLALPEPQPPCGPFGLLRRPLGQLEAANQQQLLHRWLERHSGLSLAARQLETLVQRLHPSQGPGSLDLSRPWRLHWTRFELLLTRDPEPTTDA